MKMKRTTVKFNKKTGKMKIEEKNVGTPYSEEERIGMFTERKAFSHRVHADKTKYNRKQKHRNAYC